MGMDFTLPDSGHHSCREGQRVESKGQQAKIAANTQHARSHPRSLGTDWRIGTFLWGDLFH